MSTRKIFKRILKTLLIAVSAVFLLVIVLAVYMTILYAQADYLQPDVAVSVDEYALSTDEDSLRICRDNHLLLNRYGWWEAHVKGSALERGALLGAMGRDLLDYQEKVFVDQIQEIVPDESYIRFLRVLIEIFNRNMAQSVPEEYREEIYAMSAFCSHDYDVFGTPYERQLNYHGAHDIGHTLQEYMLVGCSSFGVWDGDSADSSLLIGRNFDFYVGDRFAENRVVLFVEPDSGYRFASLTWPGMIGVVSGMNEKGLTVTINAAKGGIPFSSAMPISLLVREILQYAGNIEEAYRIASSRQTFVSESIMVGSAADHQVALIEKTPERMALYTGNGASRIICTNHYQSDLFADDRYNLENIAVSDSRYRYDRISKLIEEQTPLDLDEAVSILRDRWGKDGEDIGLTNEMSVNQSIGHHSVLFRPEELKMWVSTSPWQSGAFICYDLSKVFSADGGEVRSYVEEDRNLVADSLFIERDYPRIREYRKLAAEIRQATKQRQELSPRKIEELIAANPEFFETYETAGDYMLSVGNIPEAVAYWKKALEKQIPRLSYRDRIYDKIQHHDQR